MKVLAIDFGEARIGLAISDPEGRLAVPLTTIPRRSDQQAIERIAEIIAREEVRHLIVGEPRNLDGTLGDSAMRVRSFTGKLTRRIPLPCDLVDESLTSVEAVERLRDAGVDPGKNPERIDAVAAQVLLEQYLAASPWRETVDG